MPAEIVLLNLHKTRKETVRPHQARKCKVLLAMQLEQPVDISLCTTSPLAFWFCKQKGPKRSCYEATCGSTSVPARNSERNEAVETSQMQETYSAYSALFRHLFENIRAVRPKRALLQPNCSPEAKALGKMCKRDVTPHVDTSKWIWSLGNHSKPFSVLCVFHSDVLLVCLIRETTTLRHSWPIPEVSLQQICYIYLYMYTLYKKQYTIYI